MNPDTPAASARTGRRRRRWPLFQACLRSNAESSGQLKAADWKRSGHHSDFGASSVE
jgi:hypothetical protein